MADPYIGQIIIFAGSYAPPGWMFCNGQQLQIQTNPALYAVVGNAFGGDGMTTFKLPDLQGRVPMHFGTGTGLKPYNFAQQSGAEQITLAPEQMPAHNHTFSSVGATGTLQVGDGYGTAATPVGNYLCNSGDPQMAQGVVGYNFSPAAQAGNLSAIAGLTVNIGPGAISQTGGNQAHPNLQPSLALNFIIATVGIFPTRN